MNRAYKCILLILLWIFAFAFLSRPVIAGNDKSYQHKEITEEEFNKKKKSYKKVLNSSIKKTDKIPVYKDESLKDDDYKLLPKKKVKELPKFDPSVYDDPIFQNIRVDMKNGKVLWLPDDKSVKPFIADSKTPLELHRYEELDLQRSILIGLKRSTRIKSALESINQAVAQYEQTKTVKNATLKLDGIAQLQGPSNEIDLTIPPIINEKIIFSRDYNIVGQLTLQQLITTFGKIKHNIAASFINIRVTQEKLESEKSNVIYSIKQAFFNVLKAESMIRVSVDNVNQSKEYLENAHSLYKNGMKSRYDVVRSELQVSEAMRNLVTAKMNFLLAESNYLYNLDYSGKIPFKLLNRKKNMLSDKIKLQELYGVGMKCRHEIKELEENILISKELLQAARKENNPSVYLSGNYTRMTASSVSQDYSWNVGLNVSIPILDGGLRVAKVKEAESNIRYAEISLDSLKKQIKLQIEQAFLNLKESKVKCKASIKDVETSLEGYRMSKVRYKNGLSTPLEMEDSIRTLNRSNVNLVNAIYNYNLNLAALEYSIGRDFTPDELVELGGVKSEKKK